MGENGEMVTTPEGKNRQDGDRLSDDPFMAFLDGSLDYSCSSCPDNCCRGIGFGGMDGGRMGTLIDSHPELLPWIQYRDGGFTMLGTPQGGCLFLGDDGLCSIEAASGRDAKPGLCIMFPFNRLDRIGDRLIVRPYFRCRRFTAIVPPRPGAVAGTHSAILRDLQATGMVRKGLPQLPLPEGDDPGAVLAREGEWLTACGNALGRTRIVDTVTSFSDDASDLSRFVSRAVGLLGLEAPAEGRPRDELDDMLIILSPVMRMDHLVLSSEGMLRAILLAEALVPNAFTGEAGHPTLADLASLINIMQPLLTVLARADRPFEPLVGWQSDGRRPPLDTPDQKMAFGAMVVLTGKGRGTLPALEEALATVERPLERVLFVRRLAGLLRPAPSAARADNTGRQQDGLPSDREA